MTVASNQPPAAVLSAYPAEFGAAAWEALGNAGGFSGARLWEGRLADGRAVCLRAWPAAGMTPERLRFIHALLDKARFGRGLAFVPAVEIARGPATWVAA